MTKLEYHCWAGICDIEGGIEEDEKSCGGKVRFCFGIDIDQLNKWPSIKATHFVRVKRM